MNVHRLDDYRPFDTGTPSRCWHCGAGENVMKCVGEAGFVWSCDHCPHPEDVS